MYDAAAMSPTLFAFLAHWLPSGDSQRVDKDSFLKELCHVLDLPEPEPTQGDPTQDRYVLQREVRIEHPDGQVITRSIDLYKADCFVLETKQSSIESAYKQGRARRSTEAWENAMARTRTQATR